MSTGIQLVAGVLFAGSGEGSLGFPLTIPSDAQVAMVSLMPLRVDYAQGRKKPTANLNCFLYLLGVDLVHSSACKDAITRPFISGCKSSSPLCNSVFKQSKLPAASSKADCHSKDLTRILLSLARKKDAV